VITLIGVANKKGTKAKITLEIPEGKLKDVRDALGEQTVNDLLRLKTGELPTTGPYKIVLDKFHIQRISENNLDRTQVIESNDFPMFFAFGKGAETHQYQLNVLDGKKNMLGEDAGWLDIFEDFYDVARPHNIIDYEMEMNIIYSDRKLNGIWYNMNYDKNSQSDKVVGVAFKFFVISKERRVKVG
jgi:hypothetical protein